MDTIYPIDNVHKISTYFVEQKTDSSFFHINTLDMADANMLMVKKSYWEPEWCERINMDKSLLYSISDCFYINHIESNSYIQWHVMEMIIIITVIIIIQV